MGKAETAGRSDLAVGERSEGKLGIVEFGARLVLTEDLDPVYVALNHLKLERMQLKRWLLAYWCFYNAAVACRLSMETGREFWRLMQVADNKRWPRGRERRHFRGRTSANAIEYLMSAHYSPEGAVASLLGYQDLGGLPFWLFAPRIQSWPGFGPWVAFKAADMLERLGLFAIRFGVEEVELYDEPRAGAAVASEQIRRELGYAKRLSFSELCDGLLALVTRASAGKRFRPVIGDHGWFQEDMAGLAPPRYERPLNFQEAETIFCKWKSHLSGHYWIGQDSYELRNALLEGPGYVQTPLAANMAALVPRVGIGPAS